MTSIFHEIHHWEKWGSSGFFWTAILFFLYTGSPGFCLVFLSLAYNLIDYDEEADLYDMIDEDERVFQSEGYLEDNYDDEEYADLGFEKERLVAPMDPFIDIELLEEYFLGKPKIINKAKFRNFFVEPLIIEASKLMAPYIERNSYFKETRLLVTPLDDSIDEANLCSESEDIIQTYMESWISVYPEEFFMELKYKTGYKARFEKLDGLKAWNMETLTKSDIANLIAVGTLPMEYARATFHRLTTQAGYHAQQQTINMYSSSRRKFKVFFKKICGHKRFVHLQPEYSPLFWEAVDEEAYHERRRINQSADIASVWFFDVTEHELYISYINELLYAENKNWTFNFAIDSNDKSHQYYIEPLPKVFWLSYDNQKTFGATRQHLTQKYKEGYIRSGNGKVASTFSLRNKGLHMCVVDLWTKTVLLQRNPSMLSSVFYKILPDFFASKSDSQNKLVDNLTYFESQNKKMSGNDN